MSETETPCKRCDGLFFIFAIDSNWELLQHLRIGAFKHEIKLQNYVARRAIAILAFAASGRHRISGLRPSPHNTGVFFAFHLYG